jgi:hypothetical protein
MNPERFYYFAYGSNISSKRLKEKKRCPSAQFIGLAYVKNQRLSFPQHNKAGHLVAGYTNSNGNNLWGAIYLIEDRELDQLYTAEGFKEGRDNAKNSYTKIDLLELYDENDKIINHKVITFKQNKENSQPPAGKTLSKEYLQFIIDGYEEHNISRFSPKIYAELLNLQLK